jgi:hypothetical protein
VRASSYDARPYVLSGDVRQRRNRIEVAQR